MKLLFIIILSFFYPLLLLSNYLLIDTIPQIVDIDTIQKTCKVKFNISWENSWRLNDGPSNYDAAWVFIKYRVNSGNWKHASLSTQDSNYSIENVNGVSATIHPDPHAKGALIYRSLAGNGNNNWNGIKFQWNYGLDGVNEKSIITISLFAVEMVYVPQGAFYLGSGGNEGSHYFTYPNMGTPYLINSEDEVNVGPVDGYLSYSNSTISVIPATYPKGYKDFYCMKYEITQEQYCDFLNTLTPVQKIKRSVGKLYDLNFSYRYGIKLINGIYGCDDNNNNILNESNDGQNVACGCLSAYDGLAYADWAGLRPMTEFEFEKACRGPLIPVPNEYAWGSTNIFPTTYTVQNFGMVNELLLPDSANCNYNIDNTQFHKPSRVGVFAKSSSNRERSGSSYYGIMDLSGNLEEACINVRQRYPYYPYNDYQILFSGLTGDGSLSQEGNADVQDWPTDPYYLAISYKGGNFEELKESCRVSDRQSSLNYFYNDEMNYMGYFGFRCVYSY